MSKITGNTTLAELVGNSKAKRILANYRLPCLTCPFAESEMERLKLAEICKMYGINLEALLKDLNGVDPVRSSSRKNLK